MNNRDKDSLRVLYQNWATRMAENPQMELSALRDMFDQWQSAGLEPEGVTYEQTMIGGIDAIVAIADAGPQRPVALHLHGGGFVAGSVASHRKFGGHLARAIGGRVVLPAYGLAPENSFPGPGNDVFAVYRALLNDWHVEPSRLILSGDSAGGNLALGAALRARNEGIALPAALLLFAPFIDLLLTGETLASNAATDIIVSRPVLELMAGLYLNGAVDGDSPLVNALHADLSGLPRTCIVVSASEALYADATRLADRLKAAGVEATLMAAPDEQHVFAMAAGRSAVADAYLADAGKWLLRTQAADGDASQKRRGQ